MATKPNSIDFVIDESSDKSARIEMTSGDKFILSLAEAARACKAFDKAREFSPQFKDLLSILEHWIDENKSRIAAAHLNIREHDLLFLVEQKQKQYDTVLSDSLTKLDLTVANSGDLSLIELNVMAIPPVQNEDCTAFMADGSLTYAE